MVSYDDAGNIGKRYRRGDAIGTPYAVTIDYMTIENNVIYTVKCPQCKKKADVVMGGPEVLSGTYREAVYKPKAKLIQCNNCGFIKQL